MARTITNFPGLSPAHIFPQAAAPGDVPPVIEGLYTLLAKKHYCSLQEGKLHIPLQPEILAGAARVAREVEKNPALKPFILFDDAGAARAYDDVVWDLNARSVELAETLLKEKQDHMPAPLRVFITTPVWGNDERSVRCKPVDSSGAEGQAMRINLNIQGAPHTHPGQCYILQSNEASVAERAETDPAQRVLSLVIAAKPSAMQSWIPSLPVSQRHHEL